MGFLTGLFAAFATTFAGLGSFLSPKFFGDEPIAPKSMIKK